MNTINKVFEFGKIDFNGKGRKVNRVSVEVNLREEETNYGFKYYSFTASGEIWNARGTDCVVCGQCLDEIKEYVNDPTFLKIYDLWKKYHLNDLKAGTPAQEKAVHEYFEKNNKRYDYTDACNYLESIGLLLDDCGCNTTGRRYEKGQGYQYGHGWVIEEIPESAVKEIKGLIEEE